MDKPNYNDIPKKYKTYWNIYIINFKRVVQNYMEQLFLNISI